MEFFKKIFKALNSAQHPWQVTLSIALGMVAGLTPLNGMQTLLILFVVFLINIHIGLFFAASGLFAGIAYLFDPQMEQLGYMLLNSEGLKELYTLWYNSGLMRLSHFNNTLVMGATVISLLLAIPLFFILNVVIALYRDKIALYLNANKWFARLGIFKVQSKKEPIFRWWGAGLYVAVVGAFAVLLLLVIDPFLKWGIEKGATKLLQKDVRVASVTTHLFEGYVSIERVEVASEQDGVDAFSIENIGFDIDTNALLLSKTHIENMQLKGVGFDTPATMKKVYGKTAYKTQSEAEDKSPEAQKESSMTMPSIALPTPSELLAKSDLKSTKLYEEAKTELEAIEAKWRKIQQQQLSEAALAQYEKELAQLQADARSKDPAKLLALSGQVQSYTKKLEAQKKAVERLQKEYSADQKRLKTLLAAVKNAPQEDYAKLRSTYSLDSSGGINLFGLLFSQKIAGYLHQARRYYAQVEPYLKSDEAAPEAIPPRGEGRWIRFAESVPSPDLWIARTALSGAISDYRLEGVIRNISDNQKALGKMLTFVIDGESAKVKGLHIEGSDDRLGKKVVDTVAFDADTLEIKEMGLQKMQITDAKIAFDGRLSVVESSTVSGRTELTFREARIRLDEVGGKGAEIINDILKEIRFFSAAVSVEGQWQNPSVKVSSDIDKLLSAGFKKAMAKEIAGYKKELKVLLDRQAKEQLGELGGMSGGFTEVGKLIDQQNLSLDTLGTKAQGLGSGSSKGLSNGKDLKKRFKF